MAITDDKILDWYQNESGCHRWQNWSTWKWLPQMIKFWTGSQESGYHSWPHYGLTQSKNILEAGVHLIEITLVVTERVESTLVIKLLATTIFNSDTTDLTEFNPEFLQSWKKIHLKNITGKKRKCCCNEHCLPFLKCFYPIRNSSKLKDLKDNNFQLDENGRKFSKRVENTVGKGEIACYEQFLLFPQCFQKICTADM